MQRYTKQQAIRINEWPVFYFFKYLITYRRMI